MTDVICGLLMAAMFFIGLALGIYSVCHWTTPQYLDMLAAQQRLREKYEDELKKAQMGP
jgi:hypothetical protein